ncbi:hypothetical protein VE03_10503 [Pseudogymnoascus sp. 23342-1-I1]|nr:hypothetical protein VE03_10503 [Pseudogymnoascus sp. 23342-1-I1]
MAQTGNVVNKFRRSASNIAPFPYDNQNGFAPEQYLGIQSSNSANTTLNVGKPNNVFQHQPEAEGWTRDQMHNYSDARSSGYAQGQSSVLTNHGADATDGSDTNEDSDQGLPIGQESLTVQGSMGAQGMESSPGDYSTLRSGMRRPGREPMSTRQFKRHFDRASHRIESSQQKAGNPLGRKSKGASDPENIAIVNWYDNYNMSFQDIALRLNSMQEMKGRTGTFTPNSIHNRYNRCAPIIYRAQERVFVAIKNRKKHAPEELDVVSNSHRSIEWNALKDKCLKGIVEEYEANKWSTVAAMFTDATREMVSARTVATRYGML